MVVIAAIAAVLGSRLPASSSSTAASPTDGLRSEHRGLRGEPRGALGEADGSVPDGTPVFDDDVPGVANLDPALLGALRRAATDAAADGVDFVVDSGWRSPAYQAHLFREAVSKYGSAQDAARWVATPNTSAHVSGDAVDLGPAAAAAWLSAHGAAYGLCRVYRNEPWHYELRAEAVGHGCPPLYPDPTHDPRMQQVRRLRPSAALALVVLIVLITAGCGSDAPSETGTATAGSSGTAGSTATGGNKNATDQDKGVRFAECIRGHGVPHFPDPNAKGEFVFGIDVSPAVWRKAVDACKDLEPPGALSRKRSPKQQSAALRFAQCVRENGVKDFPDPANGEPLIDTTRIPSSNRPGGMTMLNAATQKCRSVLGLAAGGQG